MLKKITLSTLFILLCMLAVVTALYTGYLRFNYPSLHDYPVQGIDVSHHQGSIAWHQLDKQRVTFAFIKATEGGDFTDKQFIQNWQQAQQQQIVVGAYHFFTFCRPAQEQARHFIATVPQQQGTLPPVIDLEYGGNCQFSLSQSELLAEITLMIELLTHAYQTAPILYVTPEFYDDIIAGHFLQNPIWFRNIYRTPRLANQQPWTFWQYANRGHLTGIQGVVDLNVFNGTIQQFKQLLQ